MQECPMGLDDHRPASLMLWDHTLDHLVSLIWYFVWFDNILVRWWCTLGPIDWPAESPGCPPPMHNTNRILIFWFRCFWDGRAISMKSQLAWVAAESRRVDRLIDLGNSSTTLWILRKYSQISFAMMHTFRLMALDVIRVEKFTENPENSQNRSFAPTESTFCSPETFHSQSENKNNTFPK